MNSLFTQKVGIYVDIVFDKYATKKFYDLQFHTYFSTKVDHSKSKVSIVEAQVVWNWPHNNEMNVFLAQLPGNDATCSSDRIQIIDGHYNFSVGWEYLKVY